MRGWGGRGPAAVTQLCPPDRSTVVVLVPTCYEWFEEWRDEPSGKRSSDYEALKSSFVEASLSVVLKLFPQLEGKVDRPRDCTVSQLPLGQGNKTPRYLGSGEGREPMQAVTHSRREWER